MACRSVPSIDRRPSGIGGTALLGKVEEDEEACGPRDRVDCAIDARAFEMPRFVRHETDEQYTIRPWHHSLCSNARSAHQVSFVPAASLGTIVSPSLLALMLACMSPMPWWMPRNTLCRKVDPRSARASVMGRNQNSTRLTFLSLEPIVMSLSRCFQSTFIS